MNKGEVYTVQTKFERTANLDEQSINSKKAALMWEAVAWVKVEEFVNKIQTRIAKAMVNGNTKLVRELQRMLTHSYYAKLWAVKKVTGTKGKRTAGADNEKWDTPRKKYLGAMKLKQEGYKAKPLKRVYITKSNGKKRPLGIPTMTDRAMQALEALALDPIIESISDKRSFGFRKGRSCQDAMEQLFRRLAPGSSAEWVLEGDIKSCFDEISHNWLLEHTPMDKRILKEFLKAGYVYNKELFPTEQGTPQGGIISPILANFTLNGIDNLMRDNFKEEWVMGERHSISIKPKVNPVRYADDFVITARTKEIAEEAKELVRKHIEERGLKLSEEKTIITHISDGFDFLGFNFRKYNGKMLVKPSKKSQQKVKEKIRDVIKNNKTATQDNLIRMLNPIISGWSNYYRATVAKETFGKIHNMIFLLLWKWARRRHPNKGRRWIKNRYWKTIGSNQWIFMDTETLLRMSDKKIIRHTQLKLDMNPYIDTGYFQKRRYRLLVNRTFGTTLPEKNKNQRPDRQPSSR